MRVFRERGPEGFSRDFLGLERCKTVRERKAEGLESRGVCWCLGRAVSRGGEPANFPGI